MGPVPGLGHPGGGRLAGCRGPGPRPVRGGRQTGRSVMNIAVIQGHLSSAPVERVLPSGTRLLTLEISTRRPGEKADTVPVAWHDPPTNVVQLEPGAALMVVGRVRRRFFRVGAG